MPITQAGFRGRSFGPGGPVGRSRKSIGAKAGEDAP